MVYVVSSVGALGKAPVTGGFRDNIGCLLVCLLRYAYEHRGREGP
jgi:hypothetical protein